MDLLHRMGREGRTVLFSSHILEEVEQVARHIEVVVAERHAASGDFGRFSGALPRLARTHDVRLFEVSPTDESLERVFSYLVS